MIMLQLLTQKKEMNDFQYTLEFFFHEKRRYIKLFWLLTHFIFYILNKKIHNYNQLDC